MSAPELDLIAAVEAGVDAALKNYSPKTASDPETVLMVEADFRAAIEAALPHLLADVLNKAADDWQQGEWANAPRRADRAVERIANGQHVTDWLRERARNYGSKP